MPVESGVAREVREPRFEAREMVARKNAVMTRYYGWYANRARGTRRRAAEGDGGPMPVPVAAPEPLPLREARRRWAELLRRLYEVNPLVCPACGGAMRLLAFITEAGRDQLRAIGRIPPSAPDRRSRINIASLSSLAFLHSLQTRARGVGLAQDIEGSKACFE